MMPEVAYAKSSEAHVAYALLGDGPPDLLFLGEWIGHLEVYLEEPGFHDLVERLASFTRVILMDKRGTGLSDPVVGGELPSFDEWMDDLEAVLDAAGASQPTVVAVGGSAPMALTFAATHPERCAGLVVINGFARLARADDHPWGIPADVHEHVVAEAEAHWGEGVHLGSSVSPSVVGDREFEAYWRRLQRAAASPGTAALLYRMAYQADARHVLAAIRVPTLIIHATQDAYVRVEHGRFLAEQIQDSTYTEIDSQAHIPWMHDTEPVVGAIATFITGEAPSLSRARMLATVLISDIVDSTGHASRLGDAGWSGRLERHRRDAERQVVRFGGQIINWIGDGLIATFDRPSAAGHAAAALHLVADREQLQLRIGLHTGEIEVADDDISGLAVHLASRVCDRAGGGQTLSTATVRDLSIGSGLVFDPQRAHELDGVPLSWQLFELTDG